MWQGALEVTENKEVNNYLKDQWKLTKQRKGERICGIEECRNVTCFKEFTKSKGDEASWETICRPG